MNDEIQRLRRMLGGMKRGQGRRYPAAIKMAIGRATRARRDRGESWQAIAAAIGIPHETVRRFAAMVSADDERHAPAFIPVETVATRPVPHRSGLVLIRPDGIRIEGLDVVEAAELLRRLP